MEDIQHPNHLRVSSNKATTSTSSTRRSSMCNKSTAMKFAIECNNFGVQILKISSDSDHDDNRAKYRDIAYELFKGSLEVLTQISRRNNDFGGVNDSLYCCIENNERISRSKVLMRRIQENEDVLSRIKENYHSVPQAPQATTPYPVTTQSNYRRSNGFVYKFGLLIQPDYIQHFTNNINADSCRGREPLYTMISSIIIYNMGLVHHLLYLDNTQEAATAQQDELHVHRDQTICNVALNLYEKSSSLLRYSCLQTTNPKSSMLDIRMAIANNISVLSHNLGQYEKSKYYLSQLSNFISYALIIITHKNSNQGRNGEQNNTSATMEQNQKQDQNGIETNDDENDNKEQHDLQQQDYSSSRGQQQRLGLSIGKGFIEHFTLNVLYLNEPSNASAA